MIVNSQVGSDIDVTCGHLFGAYEDVPAVATGAINPDGVLASVGSRDI